MDLPAPTPHSRALPPPCRDIAVLLDLGVPIVRPEYLFDWVANPQASLEAHMLHGTQATPGLRDLEHARRPPPPLAPFMQMGAWVDMEALALLYQQRQQRRH